jgi:flagellar hook assembly protein FlgD
LPSKVTIKIFNLNGELVKQIEKNDNATTIDWSLTNSSNIRISAGIYLATVTLANGKSKVIKLAIYPSEDTLPIF